MTDAAVLEPADRLGGQRGRASRSRLGAGALATVVLGNAAAIVWLWATVATCTI